MASENVIWERAFINWNILSHESSTLPIDAAGFTSIEHFMSQNAETNAVFETVSKMLERACDPPDDQSLHQARVKHGVAKRLSTKEMVKIKNRKSSYSRLDPELHEKLLGRSLAIYADEVADYLTDQSDIAFALARTLVDLTPSIQSGKIRITNLAKPDLSKTLQDFRFANVDQAIAIVKDRLLFDLLDDGIYPAEKVRREKAIVVFFRFTDVGISALAVQMDGDDINLLDWCCIPRGDERALLDALSILERHEYHETNPELRSYYASLIGNLDLTEAQNEISETSRIATTIPKPSKTIPTQSQASAKSPAHDPAPAMPIDDLIAEKLEPVLAQLAKTEDELAQLRAATPSQPETSENEQIASLEKARGDERAEYLELIKIAEREKAEALAEAASLRAALQAQAQARADTTVAHVMTFPSSLADLEPWAAQHLLGRVYILPRAYRAMRKAIYTDTERACRALLLLAGPYHDAKNGIEGSLDRFNEGLKELRLIDKPQQMVGGAIKSAEYFITYNGERLLLDKHIRGKDSRFNDDKVLRIYYHYHAATNQILVGHMPSHLTTAAGR